MWRAIPDDVLTQILCWIPYRMLPQCSLIGRRERRLLFDEGFWRLYSGAWALGERREGDTWMAHCRRRCVITVREDARGTLASVHTRGSEVEPGPRGVCPPPPCLVVYPQESLVEWRGTWTLTRRSPAPGARRRTSPSLLSLALILPAHVGKVVVEQLRREPANPSPAVVSTHVSETGDVSVLCSGAWDPSSPLPHPHKEDAHLSVVCGGYHHAVRLSQHTRGSARVPPPLKPP